MRVFPHRRADRWAIRKLLDDPRLGRYLQSVGCQSRTGSSGCGPAACRSELRSVRSAPGGARSRRRVRLGHQRSRGDDRRRVARSSGRERRFIEPAGPGAYRRPRRARASVARISFGRSHRGRTRAIRGRAWRDCFALAANAGSDRRWARPAQPRRSRRLCRLGAVAAGEQDPCRRLAADRRDPQIVFDVPRMEIWQRAYERVGTTPMAFTTRTVGSA